MKLVEKCAWTGIPGGDTGGILGKFSENSFFFSENLSEMLEKYRKTSEEIPGKICTGILAIFVLFFFGKNVIKTLVEAPTLQKFVCT